LKNSFSTCASEAVDSLNNSARGRQVPLATVQGRNEGIVFIQYKRCNRGIGSAIHLLAALSAVGLRGSSVDFGINGIEIRGVPVVRGDKASHNARIYCNFMRRQRLFLAVQTDSSGVIERMNKIMIRTFELRDTHKKRRK
jgi:hypothetical protein